MRVITRTQPSPKFDDTPESTRRIRVTRTLVFEGSEKWVRGTLEKSWLQPDTPARLGTGLTAYEQPRVEEVIE